MKLNDVYGMLNDIYIPLDKASTVCLFRQEDAHMMDVVEDYVMEAELTARKLRNEVKAILDTSDQPVGYEGLDKLRETIAAMPECLQYNHRTPVKRIWLDYYYGLC